MEFYASGAKNRRKECQDLRTATFSGGRSPECIFCGRNQIAGHFLYWYFESSNIFFASIRRFVFASALFRQLKKIGKHLDLLMVLARLGIFLKILKTQADIQKCKAPRAKVLWEEAIKRGIVMQELLLFGKPFDVYIAESQESRVKSQKFIFSGLPRPTNYNDLALDWMDDKWLFKKKLMAYGLPAPKGGSAWGFFQAKRIFEKIQNTPPSSPPILGGERGGVAIVKPRTGSRGRHSTTFVSSFADLEQAFKVAKQLCFWAIIEEQLQGPVYRATLINYELCGVLRGDPPQVIGDGYSEIKKLIEIKNNQPHPGVHPVKSREAGTASQSFNRVKDIVIDASMELFLSRQSLDLISIPEKDEVINLSEKIGVNYGGSSSEDYDICHTDNKELFVRAAKIIGDPIVGFDFIIPDISKSYKEQKCGFIEANSLPFINLHHDPLHGQPRNVAAKVWEMMGW